MKWDGERGFGKVKRDDGTEFFVHSSYLQQTPMFLGRLDKNRRQESGTKGPLSHVATDLHTPTTR